MIEQVPGCIIRANATTATTTTASDGDDESNKEVVDVVVVQYPTRTEFESVCEVVPQQKITKIVGKISAVEELILSDGAKPRCVVLVDTYERVVSVDISALHSFLRTILRLDDLFVASFHHFSSTFSSSFLCDLKQRREATLHAAV